MSRPNYVYTPMLVGRPAELRALGDLGEDAKSYIKPIIQLPERNWDRDSKKYKPEIKQHIKYFVGRYCYSWGNHSSWIRAESGFGADTVDGVHVFEFLCRKLWENGANTSPLFRLDDPTTLVNNMLQTNIGNSSEMGILVTIAELMNDDIYDTLRNFIGLWKGRCLRFDLILDLRNPRYGERFVKLVWERLYQKNLIDFIARIVVVGTTVPQTFSSIGEGIGYLDRAEWCFYKSLVSEYAGPSKVDVVFGDYGTVHPSFRLGGVANRAFAKLCYTGKDKWVTLKRGRYYDDPAQMRNICLDVVNDSQIEYAGRHFSKGDDYIFRCGIGVSPVGPLSEWKWASLNHHFTVVTRDLLELTDNSYKITDVSVERVLFDV